MHFGPKFLTIVQSKGRKLLAHIPISRKAASAGELEQKVPEEVLLVALCKDELRKHKIDSKEIKEATLGFTGKDLIVRTFELPPMPRQEVVGAVNFETKKYLPFKAEELVSDFQLEFDKNSRKNQVMFIGIRKDALERYFSILKQLEMKPGNIEYSAFGLLRFLRLANAGQRGIVGVVSLDFQEEEEVNFTVVKDGFPLFSRDIAYGAETQEGDTPETILSRLKPEMRISLDYYNRKFPGRNIERTFILINPAHRAQVEAFCKELGFSGQYLDLMKYIGKNLPFSLGLAKAYSASLYTPVKIKPRINITAAKAKQVVVPSAGPKELKLQDVASLLSGMEWDFRFIVFGVLLCLLTFLFGLYRMSPLKKALNATIDMRPAVTTVNPEASYEQLSNSDSEYKKKVNALNDLLDQQVYLTEIMNALPRALPEGLWLTKISFQRQDSGLGLAISGRVYLGNSNKEFDAVNSFIANLKAQATFGKYFQNINVGSIDTVSIGKLNMTEFNIFCQGNQR
jgi:hypothetical protein